MQKYQFIIKRLFDVTVSFIGMVLFLPMALGIALIVKITTGGPVFFSQVRIGRNGRPFRCVKFRTMVRDSESHGTITAANDMRITKPGKFLRRLKLDEFPQLWNVFTGRMSFVGPRPDVPGYADALQGEDRLVLQLRPGITGPATIFFRFEEKLLAATSDPVVYNDTIIWPAKVRMNLHYYKHISFIRDIGYILLTLLPSVNTFFRLLPPSPRTIVEFESTLKSDAFK